MSIKIRLFILSIILSITISERLYGKLRCYYSWQWCSSNWRKLIFIKNLPLWTGISNPFQYITRELAALLKTARDSSITFTLFVQHVLLLNSRFVKLFLHTPQTTGKQITKRKVNKLKKWLPWYSAHWNWNLLSWSNQMVHQLVSGTWLLARLLNLHSSLKILIWALLWTNLKHNRL